MKMKCARDFFSIFFSMLVFSKKTHTQHERHFSSNFSSKRHSVSTRILIKREREKERVVILIIVIKRRKQRKKHRHGARERHNLGFLNSTNLSHNRIDFRPFQSLARVEFLEIDEQG